MSNWYSGQETEGAVEFLCGFAKGGDALELGIGTGRMGRAERATAANILFVDYPVVHHAALYIQVRLLTLVKKTG